MHSRSRIFTPGRHHPLWNNPSSCILRLATKDMNQCIGTLSYMISIAVSPWTATSSPHSSSVSSALGPSQSPMRFIVRSSSRPVRQKLSRAFFAKHLASLVMLSSLEKTNLTHARWKSLYSWVIAVMLTSAINVKLCSKWWLSFLYRSFTYLRK